LLIVNADDWGIEDRATDAIARCVEAGRVTSISAMVWMRDAERAARLARERGIPAGLHFNLIEPYVTKRCERQERVAAWFGASRRRRWLPAVGLRRDIRYAVEDQLEGFREHYGTEPTHIDGHQHFHLNPTVLAALPKGQPVRASFTFEAREKSWLNRAARAVTNQVVQRRFGSTRWFFDIAGLQPGQLEVARSGAVEVMCHPGREEEERLLLSDEWAEAVGGLELGSFADLRT
jgi:chitin disaccharide deacetylase